MSAHLKPNEAAELTAKGGTLLLPDGDRWINVRIKVGPERAIDYDDRLTQVCIAAAKWTLHDFDQVVAERLAQFVVQTMRALP